MGKAQRTKRRRQTDSRPVQTAAGAGGAVYGVRFWVLCLLLVVSTLAVYWQVTSFPLINCDDRDYVTNNPIVKAGLTSEGLHWAFNVGYAGNWHPLTWLSHMLDSNLYGPSVPDGPGAAGRHLTNLLLHTANTLLLFVVLTCMTGFVWRSAFVAALFALHPQHVESVAWVAERKDVLSTLFLLLALWAYSFYASKKSASRYVLVMLAFALGLMAKPMLVTLPVLLLLLDFWPLRRFRNGWDWSLVWEKVPMLALSVVSSILTVNAQRAAGAVKSIEDLSLAERVSNALMSYAIYIVKTFWPTRLGNYYTYPRDGWPAPEVLGAAVALAVVTYLAIRHAGRRSWLFTGWMWYVLTLVPVIGIVQVGSQARADRYTYVPLTGVFIIIAFLVPEIVARLRPEARDWANRVVSVLAVISIAALGAATYAQVGHWRDGVAVARRAIAVTEDNWFEKQSLGSLLQDEAERLSGLGRGEEVMEIAREAAQHLRESIAIEPSCADAHNDLGRALALMGDYDGAIRHYLNAIEINPNHALAPNNLGNTYLNLNRVDEAIKQYERTLEVDPRNIFATYNMGLAFLTSGDADSGIRQFLRVLELQPNDYFSYWARYHAAELYRRKHETEEADRLLREAVELNRLTGIDPNNDAQKLIESPSDR